MTRPAQSLTLLLALAAFALAGCESRQEKAALAEQAGMQLIGQDDAAAITHLERAVHLDPRRDTAYVALSEARLGVGEDVAAKQAAESALAIRESPQALVAKARACVSLSELATAVEAYSRARELDGGLATTLKEELAETYAKHGDERAQEADWEGAITSWQSALGLAPALSDLHFKLGNAHSALGHEQDAINAFKTSIDQGAQLFEARMKLAEHHFAGDSRDGISRALALLRDAADHTETGQQRVRLERLRLRVNLKQVEQTSGGLSNASSGITPEQAAMLQNGGIPDLGLVPVPTDPSALSQF